MAGRKEPLVSPEQADAILKKDFANVVAKVKDGKTLLATERTLLQSIAGSPTDQPPDGRSKAKNITDLCKILGVTTPTLRAWRKRLGAPQPNSDSSWDVAPWREFMQAHDLKGRAGAQILGDASQPDGLKARRLLVDIETREEKLAVLRGESIPVGKVREFFGTRVGEVIAILRNSFESELPPLLTGKSAIEIREVCRGVIDETVAALNRGDV